LRTQRRLTVERDDLRGHRLPRRNVDSKNFRPAAGMHDDDVFLALSDEKGLILAEDRVHVAEADRSLAFGDEEEVVFDLVRLPPRHFITRPKREKRAGESLPIEDGLRVERDSKGMKSSDQWSHDDSVVC